MTSNIKQRLLKYNTPRRIVQFLSFIFLSAIIFNLGALPLLLPVLWTWGLNPNTGGDAFTAIQLQLSGWNFTNVVFPWLAVASFLIVGILIGKAMCGWVCPFGFVQELVGFIKRKQTDVSARTHDEMVYAKYIVLGIAVFVSLTYSVTTIYGIGGSYGSALGVFANAPFTAVSPAETLFAVLPRAVQSFSTAVSSGQVDVLGGIASVSPLIWVEIIIMGGVLIFAAYVPRSWCRYFCPHGAIMALLNRFSFIGLRRDPVKCAKGGCRLCVEVCPMRVPILDQPWEKFSHAECIYCMKCVDACQDRAIRLKYP